MKRFSKPQGFAIVVGAIAAGGILGGGIVASAQPDPASPSVQDEPPAPVAASMETNEAGQKLGDYVIGADEVPDLVPVMSDEGKDGYAYRSDIDGPLVKSPVEAVEAMRDRVDEQGNIVVPVYDRDGETVIGKVTLGVIVEDDGEEWE